MEYNVVVDGSAIDIHTPEGVRYYGGIGIVVMRGNPYPKKELNHSISLNRECDPWSATAPYCEYTGLYEGVMYVLQHPKVCPEPEEITVYVDSKTALKWVNGRISKDIKCKPQVDSMNKELEKLQTSFQLFFKRKERYHSVAHQTCHGLANIASHRFLP